jgi:hypothetical protein
MLPKSFNKYGLLPAEDYELSLEDLKKSILIKGPSSKSPTWDSAWRFTLVENLSIMIKQLWKVGIEDIFIDGSFVEDKDHPNDIDGYFECDIFELASGDLQRELNLLDPNKIWTWDPDSRKYNAESCKKELPMWHTYRIELYPHGNQDSGIKDKFGYPLMFPSAFRQSRRERRQKGIIKIKRNRTLRRVS